MANPDQLHRRRVIVACSNEIATRLLRGEIDLPQGIVILESKALFDSDVILLKLQGGTLPVSPEGAIYPLATLDYAPDKPVRIDIVGPLPEQFRVNGVVSSH